MRLVIIESPYKGDRERNVRYLRACIRDCLRRGEAPFASHRMYTDALDDDIPEERALGIEAGLAWRDVRQPVWDDEDTRDYVLKHRQIEHAFYTDLGHTQGMLFARMRYDNEQIPHEERTLPPDDPFFAEYPPNAPIAAVRRDLTEDEDTELSVFAPNLRSILNGEPPREAEETRKRAREELAAILHGRPS